MAKDPLLRDAVRAIKAKIETAAEIATPEELAYLGTAIDRIGGRATVLEVEEIGDIKKDEITAHALAVETATINTITATRTAAENTITATRTAAEASVTQTQTAALAVLAQTQTSTVATVNTAAQTAIQQATASRDQTVTATQTAAQQATVAAQAAASQAVAAAQAAAHSVTQQLVLGRRTFFYGQL